MKMTNNRVIIIKASNVSISIYCYKTVFYVMQACITEDTLFLFPKHVKFLNYSLQTLSF